MTDDDDDDDNDDDDDDEDGVCNGGDGNGNDSDKTCIFLNIPKSCLILTPECLSLAGVLFGLKAGVPFVLTFALFFSTNFLTAS